MWAFVHKLLNAQLNMANPFMEYKKQAITTMSGSELIITLYDEVVKNINVAITLYDQKNEEVARTCTLKCRNIFDHFILVLDFNYPVSHQLFSLYNFFKQELISADIKRSSAPLKEILPLITDLKGTWGEAQKLAHLQK